MLIDIPTHMLIKIFNELSIYGIYTLLILTYTDVIIFMEILVIIIILTELYIFI